VPIYTIINYLQAYYIISYKHLFLILANLTIYANHIKKKQ